MGACLGLTCTSQQSGKPVSGINKKRGCTDFPFLALFVAWWAAAFLVLGLALGNGGDPKKLIYRTDYKGDICSTGPEAARPLAAWLSPSYSNLYICVPSCAEVRIPFYLNSSTQFVRQCIPPPEVLATVGGFGGASENMANAMADVLSAAGMIGAGAGIAIVLAFIYVWFLRMFAGCLVWTAITGTIIGGAFIGWTFLEKSNKLKAEGVQVDQANATMVFAYIVLGLTGLFTLIVLALRKRIKIAVEVVKEASRAIADLPGTLIFPLFTLAFGLCYFAFWIWGTFVIFSVRVESLPIAIAAPGQVQAAYMIQRQTTTDVPAFTEFKSFTADPAMQQPFLVFFFHLLWNVQFLIYFTFGVVAGAVADWYFTARDPESGKKIRGSGESELAGGPVRRACWRIIRYHLGTIAFGSFIIAVVQFIRAMVKYIEKQSKTKNNKVQKAIFCAIQCCLKCLECCLDKLSKNAFVWNAIYGDPFCVSAVHSFKLIWANLARVAAINLVSGYLLLIGKIVVAVFTAGIVGVLILQVEPYRTTVSSPLFPALVTLMLAYMVGSLFMVVYETTIDTIFLCFLVDEVNNGSGEMLASKSLQAVIGKYAAESEKLAAKEKAAPGEKIEDPKK